ncbi:Stage II sporulation protein [Enhygromyxa salina]|uniref:Stage II sporulation protein n=1 Tax=Enhygromyxa salina TaxID=215803 RepID=A0A2S9XHQ6_9BACT|nr:SpoIID/LytB domain-containing protein [Enhygromyxa salina]PRP92201.1 Stage II sporulation protein [Enhygromyxa salina]
MLTSIICGLSLACSPDDQQHFRADYTPAPSAWIPAPLPEAYCEILVEGKGVKDMETDYLPHVITCENGGANLEALKAQAIAARSVAYYYIANQGSVCDSQGCQVYTCGAEPSAAAYQAVEETSGMYLNFNGVLTYAFYVAGDPNTPAPSCVGDVDVGTEHWVTYNENMAGPDVEQTALGWVFEPDENGFGQNRGCMSQWGARCLENNNGYGYEDILRFYYGEDTNLTQAQGACIGEVGDGDGDSGDGDSGDGDGDSGDGDGGDSSDDGTASGDGEGEGDTSEECYIGALDCMCTMGGSCDEGLICVDGYCEPEGSADDGTEGDGGGETGGSGGFQDDAFVDGVGCGCAAEPAPGREGALLGFALLGLLGLRRRSADRRRR